jgi:hypothetical protein
MGHDKTSNIERKNIQNFPPTHQVMMTYGLPIHIPSPYDDFKEVWNIGELPPMESGIRYLSFSEVIEIMGTNQPQNKDMIYEILQDQLETSKKGILLSCDVKDEGPFNILLSIEIDHNKKIIYVRDYITKCYNSCAFCKMTCMWVTN